MIYKVPFEYTTLITFLTLLKYEGKRNISIVNLITSRNTLLDKALDDYYSKNVEMYALDDWQGEVFFEGINLKKELLEFLKMYKNIVSYENDEIILKENITIEKLEGLINKFNINKRIFTASQSEAFFDSLNLKKAPNLVKAFSNLEKDIEGIYLKYMNNENSKLIEQQLKYKLFERLIYINNISLLDDNTKDALANYSRVISCNDDNYEYKDYPFDEEHYYKSKYFDEIFSLDDYLYELNQYAIFGKGKIYHQKVYELLSNINMEFKYNYVDEEDEYENEYEYEDLCDDSIKKENDIINYFNDDYELFTIYYIKNINDYMQRYGKNNILNLAKYRLLYVIDNPDLRLYKDENFNKIFELIEPIVELNIMDFNENEDDFLKPLNCYKNEAEYFVISCFKSEFDKYTIKKLLFIATYYELTHDERIEKLLEKYKDNMNYEFYKSVIYNKDMGYNKHIKKN